MFGSLFDREIQAVEQSKRDYQTASDFRRRRILEFRRNALHWISAENVHATFLMNERFNSFMACTGKGGSLLLGCFADPIFPKLTYVSDDEPVAVRNAAVEKLDRDIKAFDLLKTSGFVDSAKTEWEKEYLQAMFSNGFYVIKKVEPASVFRGVLKKNDEILGYSDCWDPQPDGYFHNLLKEHVATPTKIHRTSEVMFRIDFLSALNKRNYFRYQFLYDDMHNRIPELREEFDVNLSSMKAFIQAIEGEFRVAPEYVANLDAASAVRCKNGLSGADYRGTEAKAFTGVVA